jgi:putative hemolysin
MHHLGRIPMAGEHFRWDGLSFEVMDMDGKRVDKIMVAEVPEPPAAPGQNQEPPEDHPDA